MRWRAATGPRNPPRGAGRLGPVIAALATACLTACSPVPDDVDPAPARAHVRALAGAIGARPHGSAAAIRARDYIARQLRAQGFDVRVQDTDSVDARRGLTARVRNVIACRDGRIDAALALVSHYDSRPGAPGARDDAFGVAVSLDAARQLAAADLRHSLCVLVTDAEELGLMGARALVTDAEVAHRVVAFLNFEATGGAGPALLFEATGGSALEAWARASSAPEGTSLGTEIYARLPNDTDFTLLRALGIDGLNFAPIGDSYAYHTTLDTPARLTDATIAHALANAVSIIRALDERQLTAGTDAMTFFDLAGRRGLMYGPGAASVVAVAAAVLAAVAWVLLGVEGRRRAGLERLLVTAAGGLISVGAAAGGLAGAAWLIPWARAEAMPWYAVPTPYFVFIATTGLAAGWGAMRATRMLPLRFQPWRAPSAVWWMTLPVWVAGSAAAHLTASAASFLVTLPLLVAALGLVLMPRATFVVRVVSAAVLAVAVLLWLLDTVRLLYFAVPLFGWMLVAPPWWLFALGIGPALLMMLPPAAAMVAGREPLQASPRVLLAVVVGPVLLAGSAALAVPAYSDERPQRRTLTYVEDAGAGLAWWEIGGREIAEDLAETLPMASWTPVEPHDVLPGARSATDVAARRVRTVTPPAGSGGPAVVTADATGRDDGAWDVALSIVPRELTSAHLILPPGVEPRESSLAGRLVAGRWTAVYAAVPAGGLTVRLVLDDVARVEAGLVIAFVTATVPGGSAAAPLPDWVPRRRSTWSTRAVFVVPVALPPRDGG